MTILAWLLGSKIGRYAAVAALIAAAAVIAVMMIRADERRKAALKSSLETLKRLQERIATDETIRALPPDERRRRLSEWSR